MENIESLAHLEMAVDKLLKVVKEMKQEKLVLKERVANKTQEIEGLKRDLQTLQSERIQIDQRVSGLLDSIDKWEELNVADGAAGEAKGDDERQTLF